MYAFGFLFKSAHHKNLKISNEVTLQNLMTENLKIILYIFLLSLSLLAQIVRYKKITKTSIFSESLRKFSLFS